MKNFKEYLIKEEKTKNTIEKYIRDVTAFMCFLHGRNLCKEAVIEYKNEIMKK